METRKMTDVIPSAARNLALFFLPLTLGPRPHERSARFLAALGMTPDGAKRADLKGSATPLWLVMALLVLGSGSLGAAQKPRASSKPAGKPDTSLARARWHVLGARPLALYYYYPDSRGIESLEQHASQVTLFAPQSFCVDAHGVVHGEVPSQILQTARRANVPVMPLLVNQGFDRRVANVLLRSARAQERAVLYLAYLAKRDNFIGWQFDLEDLDPADKRRYTQFAHRAAARLHRDGRLLSVAVVPRFSDVYPDADRSQEFHSSEWSAPYDFRALGRVVDFMTLMTYDHHNSTTPPGPVAGYDWVKAALDYATRRVPSQKLLLGVPFYGREWVQANDKTSVRTLTFAEAQNRMEQLSVERLWDERYRTPGFQYRDASGLHTGWYEDRRSLEAKLELMQKYHLRGFAAWRLGVEDPRFWTLGSREGRTEQQHQKRGPHRPESRAPLGASDR